MVPLFISQTEQIKVWHVGIEGHEHIEKETFGNASAVGDFFGQEPLASIDDIVFERSELECFRYIGRFAQEKRIVFSQNFAQFLNDHAFGRIGKGAKTGEFVVKIVFPGRHISRKYQTPFWLR